MTYIALYHRIKNSRTIGWDDWETGLHLHVLAVCGVSARVLHTSICEYCML